MMILEDTTHSMFFPFIKKIVTSELYVIQNKILLILISHHYILVLNSLFEQNKLKK